MQTHWIVRMDGPSGRVSAVWDTRRPFTIGQPLRWVVELRNSGRVVRVIDTLKKSFVEKPVHNSDCRAVFDLTGQARVTFWQEQARVMSPVLESRNLVDPNMAGAFKKSLMQATAALAVAMMVPVLMPKPKKIEIVATPVAVMQLAKSMAPRPVAQTQAAAMAKSQTFASRIKSFVQGSASRWLAATSFNSFSANTFTKFQAAFGNSANPTDTGNIKLQGGLSQSAAAGSAGIGNSKDWVNLDTLAATVQEGLTKDEVGEVIHRHMKEIRYCYETAMMRVPDLEGKTVVNFTIGRQGSVRASAVSNTTISDPRLNDCVVSKLAGWKFPQPKGGIDVAVSYPFLFKTLGK